MGNPLDDALRSLDEQAARRRRDKEDANRRKRQFDALVNDFLSRMNSAGNPGARYYGNLKASAWTLIYGHDSNDYDEVIFLTVDGRIRKLGSAQPVRVAGFYEISFDRYEIGTLTSSMASLLRKYGVG
jgi:hypothetical protein